MFLRNSYIGRFSLFVALFYLCITFTGCAVVKVSLVSNVDYMSLRRSDILTTGELSVYTAAALQVFDIDKNQCGESGDFCREVLMNNIGLDAEDRLSALAELWMQKALSMDIEPVSGGQVETIINAYLETARYAYAYLFLTERLPDERALENRQTQVLDYYNFAVQKTLTTLFKYYQEMSQLKIDLEQGAHLQSGPWNITIKAEELRLADKRQLPDDLIPASLLSFSGLRNQYHRDGLGAELVAVTSERVVSARSAKIPYSETPFPAVTTIISFPGKSLEEVLATHDAVIKGYDPYSRVSIKLAGKEIPLSANFTAAYGLWLARSGFAAQSLLTLIGKGDVLEKPRIYLMQPYNPNHHIAIMLHGLASSPEAWVNLANEILGDETLRQNFQIWQIYYPTNAPIALNNHEIRKAIEQTLACFDPEGTTRSSRDILLIGHSMGGMLSRLMVSSSGDRLWDAFLEKFPLEGKRLERVREKLGPYMYFQPLPQVSRAIFIAAPHRGTPVAEIALVRWLADFVTVPLDRFKEIAQLLVDPKSVGPVSLIRPLNSIDNLSSHDHFVQLTADLPISSRVRYHSIIGNRNPRLPLKDSSDGVVPYSSAHLQGADSELVVSSGHSVQETPQAIIEIRRIMHLHLKELGIGTADESIAGW
ncbi:MAG TPA: alpha/beta fold hydrolase [Smithellaceae bacterium]|nr:alpha/beta fold hydrolase [Smithellaceae bacterium]